MTPSLPSDPYTKIPVWLLTLSRDARCRWDRVSMVAMVVVVVVVLLAGAPTAEPYLLQYPPTIRILTYLRYLPIYIPRYLKSHQESSQSFMS